MAWSGSFDIFIEVILIELCCEVLIDRNIDLSLSVMFFFFFFFRSAKAASAHYRMESFCKPEESCFGGCCALFKV